jgi:hypothetical protein
MKIVSLRYVDAEMSFWQNDYQYIELNGRLRTSDGYHLFVTEIKYYDFAEGMLDFAHYQVTTEDGHIRTLPADKYVAEWSD